VLSVPGTARLTPRELVDLACVDLVNRFLHMVSASGAAGVPRPVRLELARRLAAQLHGESGEGISDPPISGHWDRVASKLQFTDGVNLFGDADPVGASVEAHPIDDRMMNTELTLPLRDMDVPEVPRPLVLKKTRRSSAMDVNDFIPLNALSYVPESVLRDVLDEAIAVERASEGAAYLAAAAAYVLGEFELCVRSLARCIRFDADVEEYWHLLAFALRFLKRLDHFNAIMFGGVRSAEILDSLEPLPARTL
jgi:hypothetical protein